ncbi:MAG: hypothetical protein SFU56_22670 [Capsulimonadales bacterium]|nr:hypothetical protein [Capsulimonadales bacterium]
MRKWIGIATAITLIVGIGAPAFAQDSRQKDKNTMRNIGIGVGAAAAYEALRGKGTNALILGAGAAYAGKKYEDARKAQARENNRKVGYYRVYRYRNGKRIGYYTYRNGKRLGYRSLNNG